MVYRVSERRYAGWLIADLESKSEGCCVQFEGSPGLGLMTSCFQANAFKPFCLIELLARPRILAFHRSLHHKTAKYRFNIIQNENSDIDSHSLVETTAKTCDGAANPVKVGIQDPLTATTTTPTVSRRTTRSTSHHPREGKSRSLGLTFCLPTYFTSPIPRSRYSDS
jgi:hypothetical protein